MRASVFVLSALAALAVAGCGGAEESAPPGQTTRAAPEIEGISLDGERLSLEDFRGRPVFVNVWSSW